MSARRRSRLVGVGCGLGGGRRGGIGAWGEGSMGDRLDAISKELIWLLLGFFNLEQLYSDDALFFSVCLLCCLELLRFLFFGIFEILFEVPFP